MSDLDEQLAEAFKSGFHAGERASQPEALSSPYDKSTKAEANYRRAETDAESCSTCKHYDADNRHCDVVSGVIAPTGVSDLWEGVNDEDDGGGNVES